MDVARLARAEDGGRAMEASRRLVEGLDAVLGAVLARLKAEDGSAGPPGPPE